MSEGTELPPLNEEVDRALVGQVLGPGGVLADTMGGLFAIRTRRTIGPPGSGPQATEQRADVGPSKRGDQHDRAYEEQNQALDSNLRTYREREIETKNAAKSLGKVLKSKEAHNLRHPSEEIQTHINLLKDFLAEMGVEVNLQD